MVGLPNARTEEKILRKLSGVFHNRLLHSDAGVQVILATSQLDGLMLDGSGNCLGTR